MENAAAINNLEQDATIDADICGQIRKGTLEDLLRIRYLPELMERLPPDPSSYRVLEEMMLLENAANTPIITADIDGVETGVDGHRKINVIRKYPERNITFYIKKLPHVHTVEDAIWWIIRNCQSYRRLNRVQRVKLALIAERIYKKLAAENKKRCGKKKNLSESDKFNFIRTVWD